MARGLCCIVDALADRMVQRGLLQRILGSLYREHFLDLGVSRQQARRLARILETATASLLWLRAAWLLPKGLPNHRLKERRPQKGRPRFLTNRTHTLRSCLCIGKLAAGVAARNSRYPPMTKKGGRRKMYDTISTPPQTHRR